MMKTLLDQLSEKFKAAILAAYPNLASMEDLPIEVVVSSNEKFRHYQCNSPMKLSKVLKQNPRAIAEKILSHVQLNDMAASMEIAGPGFINITLKPEYLSMALTERLGDPEGAIRAGHKPQRIIIDFSSPNTAKEMHVGHLRSTIIGDCLARLFEFFGDDVLRLNHIGDWGTAFGMLIAYLRENYSEVVAGKQTLDLTQLVNCYKEAKQRFDADPDFKRTSQQAVVRLQQGDPESLQAWKVICAISRKAYEEIYTLLDVRLIERGESFYNPLLEDLIRDLEKKGLVVLSDGAKCIFIEGFQNREGDPLPLMVQKSDGGYNYDTTDMATIRHRIADEKGDRLIYVTDAGQSQHFQMIFKAAEKAGYLDPKKVRVDHVGFGLVLGPDGKKFKTRSGETEKLIDLLLTAVEKARQILKERHPDKPKEEIDQLAKAIGLGAVKYADLASHRVSDYSFSYDKMLRFEGNTAAFLMYAYVRIASIKRKVGIDVNGLKKTGRIKLEHPSEIALALHLLQFDEALEQVANDLLPNRLTDYLYGLAEKFNAFFRDCRVEGSPEQESRLLLCETTGWTMKQGLHILGIETVEKM